MRPRYLTLFLAAALASCESGRAIATNASDDNASLQPGIGMESSVVGSSFYSGFAARRRLVIRDAATWDTVWTRLVGSVMPVPPTPAVDFTTKMVIVATMGSHSSGGFSISIDAVSRNGDVVIGLPERGPYLVHAQSGASTEVRVAETNDPDVAAAEVTVRSDDGDVVVERVGPGRGRG
jgi:hypothetical protein